MRKFKNLISSIIFILIINIFFGTVATKANPSEDYEISVTYGIEGHHKGNGYIPINVELKPLNKEFKGEIEVRVDATYNTYDAYSTEVIVAQDETINVTIPVNTSQFGGAVSVHLIENGESIEERKILMSAGRVLDNKKFVGILSDDMNALSYLGDIRFDYNIPGVGDVSLETVELNPSLLVNELNIDNLDLIIVSNYNLASLGEREIKNLNSWVESGGGLIISTGINESKVLDSINGNLIDIQSIGVKNKDVVIGNSTLNLALSELNIKDGQSKSKSGEDTLVHLVEKGHGQILVFSFDIGVEPFISTSQSVEYLSNILREMTEEIDRNFSGVGGNNFYFYSGILDNIPVDGVLSSEVIIVVLAVYIVIIGIVLYIVLKKIKKRDLMWISIPLIACITSGILYLMASNFRLEEVILNQLNIIEVNEEGEGISAARIAIGNKYKNDMILKKPENINMEYEVEDNYLYAGDREVERKLGVKTTYTLNDSYFTFENSEALKFNKFAITGKEVQIPNFETSLTLVDGRLNGSFKNNLDTEAKRVLLVAGNVVWDLGNVKEGEIIEFNDESNKTSAGLLGYVDMLRNDYYNYLYRYADRDEKYEGEFEHMEMYLEILQQYYEGGTSMGKAELLVFTDLPVDYGVDFEGKSVSKYDTTIISQIIDIEFKDENGKLTYPAGYFKGIVTPVTSNIYFEGFTGQIYKNDEKLGVIEVQYNITEDMDILDVKIVEGSTYYGKNYGLEEISIYNYRTGTYDYATDGDLGLDGYKVESLDDYIEDGVFKIKISIDDAAIVPDIMVTGEEK